jgi:hypothetical protein
MRPVVLSAAMLEIHSFLQALNQIQKDLEGHSEDAEEMSAILLKTKQFYEEMDRILHLMDRYTLRELIELLEKNKK